MKSNYNKTPRVEISKEEKHILLGWEAIIGRMNEEIKKASTPGLTIVLETYQGVQEEEVKNALEKYLLPHSLFNSNAAFKSEENIENMVFPDVTDDRIFGFMTELCMKDFLDEEKTRQLKKQVEEDTSEVKVVYGFGASLCTKADLIFYLDMARWEIQLRMRDNEIGNMGVSNKNIDVARRYKQSFFVDWRVLDRHKTSLFDKIDYFIDTNKKEEPKLLAGDTLRAAYKEINKQPFRVVPFFDPGPWGGQWMKDVMDLDRSVSNYAWSFDCVPEENSILLGFGQHTFETPAMNLIKREPQDLLGGRVVEKFGAEFPIRFDFLDTMAGGNLSLQVHPDKKYIRENFGMPYTQDESYYLLDTKEDAVVYLGLKEDVIPEQMISELKEAQVSGEFDADKHVAKFPVKKHDHVLIPAGTVHCSGTDSVVLEISATPYIFTFKLWDWGRLGLDGQPRPINIEHGEKVIDWSRTTGWVKDNLINQIEKIEETEVYTEEKTGLHSSVFIETRRHWFTGPVPHSTHGSVNILNLVEGKEAIVESPEAAFEPFHVHYAETFIVPASVEKYTIRPAIEGEKCATIKAFVRETI